MTTVMRDLLRSIAPLVGNDKVAKYWHAYLVSNEEERRELQQVIEVYASKLLRDHPAQTSSGLFPPPPQETCFGEVPIGYVKYGGSLLYPIGLRLDELSRHVGAYGSSGSGKTNALALVLDGLNSTRVPWILLDFKQTYRSLLKNSGFEELLVFTAGDARVAPFGFNPLIPPPDSDTDIWTKKVVGSISHAFCQGAGSESILIGAIQDAYKCAAALGRYPTFIDVLKILEDQPARGRRSLWMDSARRAVQSLTTGNAVMVFCPDIPLDLTHLLTRCIVIEMDQLNQAEQTFCSEALLLWLLQYRMQTNRNREQLLHAVIIEEAHHLLRSPPGVGDGSEPVIHTALREVRELGESIILATQNASIVPLPVYGNQGTTLAFLTKHQKDLSSTAQAMLLRDEGKDELGRLPVGEAIIRVPRWPDPIHVALKHRPIAKGAVTNEDIRHHMQRIWYSSDTTPFQPPTPKPDSFSVIPPPDDIHVIESESPFPQTLSRNRLSASPPPTTPEIETGKVDLSKPSELERAFLKDIAEHPFDGVVQRIKRLRTSRRKGVAALRALTDRGFVKPVDIFTGASLLKLYDLPPDGRRIVRAFGHNLPNPNEGGIEHRYWVHNAVRQLRDGGWTATPEYRASDDLIVDIHIECDNRRIAVLVETGKSNVEKNLLKTAACGYDVVVVASHRADVQRRIAKCCRQINSPSKLLLTTPLNINQVLRPVLAEGPSK